MVFIETPIFTRQLLEILVDDQYNQLQLFLSEHLEERGKRGGARVIYYWRKAENQL